MTGLNHKPRAFALVFSVILAIFLFSFAAPPAHAQTPTITMTTIHFSLRIIMAGSGEAVIDWGAGKAQTVTLNARGQLYRAPEDFPDGPKTIRVTAVTGIITELGLSYNNLTSLDVSSATALTELDCKGNRLTSLDLSRNLELTELICEGNSLTSLDLSRNLELTKLMCEHNNLTSLDLSRNPALTFLDCENNQLNTDALNALFRTLHSNTGRKILHIGANPGYDTCDRSIAEDKGWYVGIYKEGMN